MSKYKVIKSREIFEKEEKKESVLNIYWLENIITNEIIKIDVNLNLEIGVILDLEFKASNVFLPNK